MDYEAVLKGVTWEAGPMIRVPDDPNVLYATHEGRGEILGIPFRCYRLSDGRAVIHADDMHKIMDALGGDGESRNG